MFIIRKIQDAVASANNDVVQQVLAIMKDQFPTTRPIDFLKLPLQLNNPLKFRFKSTLLVAENSRRKVKGFAMILYFPDINIIYLELISSAPGITGGGIGGALYERVREEATALGTHGIFLECSVDNPAVIDDPKLLKQNAARLRFYESFGARPIINNIYDSPVHPGDKDLYYLVYDGLGMDREISKREIRRIVRAILDRKYSDLISPRMIQAIAKSFTDDFIKLRPPKYNRKTSPPPPAPRPTRRMIALIVNEGHDIHHVKDRGYVESPVRIARILSEINKTVLFTRISPQYISERLIREVHHPLFVSYLRRVSVELPAGKSIYPIIFPLRNLTRPPKDFELELGYYCMDTFTPLNANAYHAAKGAVECAVTGAKAILDGWPFSYALVRPPGHHAERRFFGGFCYFNSAAVATHYLSDYGRVAVLDLDYHHGNGTQNIFYRRADVFTVSIHGAPPKIYPHFAGFADERGEDEGKGYNCNIPLPEQITPDLYRKSLKKALRQIVTFRPAFLVIALGLDTAKADPTGTWPLVAPDFHENGRMIGNARLPTLIVQEGGYRTRTLGTNARAFFEGLWAGYEEQRRK